MELKSVNPATGEVNAVHPALTVEELVKRVERAQSAFKDWAETSLEARATLFRIVADHLEQGHQNLAELMASEMGKPIRQGRQEVLKCADVCRYYAEKGQEFLAVSLRATEAKKSYVRYDPLGVVLAIMPWNFPFWQAFRCAASAMITGNVVLLKHASSVPGCALAIEKLFSDAGFPERTFQSLLIPSQMVEIVIKDKRVRAATLTGSSAAGRAVAALAGTYLKPTVLELGGSDAFVVFKDAELPLAAKAAVSSRCINSGQSCIAAKRFFVEREVYDHFLELFIEEFKKQRLGDPMSMETDIGPLVDRSAVQNLWVQVKTAQADGAEIAFQGQVPTGNGAWFPPIVLTRLPRSSAIWQDELFGPVALVSAFDSAEEALELVNDTPYGLGASIWTADTEFAEGFAAGIDAGVVFVNDRVRSDIRIPFGGVKDSGFGRELAQEGMLAMLNIKSVWVA